ncbi:MAG: maleylpyruvate isomerase family mycothiol-dependent enzyme [Frankiales bacterium]|nr:maleylpyruvate isomerase family mycothiol-dependent enzyme [Frankiales bacterium]
MTTRADRVIEAERRVHERTAAHVAALGDDALTAPSAAKEWSVAQVLSHLGSAAEIHRDTLRHARRGEARGADGNQAVWDRWNAMTPREQAEGFLAAGRDLLAEYDDLGPEERESLRVPLAYLPQPAPLDLFAGLRLNEAAVHGWDVAVASDPAADLDAEIAALLVELLRGPIGFLPGFTGKADQLAEHALLAVDAGGERFGLDIGERVQLVDEPESPTGHLQLPVGAFIRLITGRFRPTDPLELSGPVGRADLLRVFPGY